MSWKLDEMREEIIRRLTPIFRDILNPDVVVTEYLDASQVAEWDSLNHISIIAAIESEFQVEFTIDELAQMANAGDLIRTLEAKV